MPDASYGGGSYNSGYGSASKTATKTTNTAAAKAASSGSSRPSGAGASLGSFASAAAVGARTASSAAARNQTSNAAAKTSLPSQQRSNAAMKTSLPAGGNTASRGLARLGMGDKLSMSDSLNMRQPDGLASYRGLAALTAKARPTVNQIVAGYAPQNPNKGYISNASEIGSLAGPMPAFQGGRMVSEGVDYGAQMMANALSRAPRTKDVARVPTKAEPTAVAGYRNPDRAFPARPQVQEANYMAKTAIPQSAYARIARPAAPPSPVRLADVPQVPASTFQKGVTQTPTDMIAGGYGAYQQAPAVGGSPPAQGTQTASLGPGQSPWDKVYGTGVRNVLRKAIQEKTRSGTQVAALPASSDDETSVQHPVYDGDTSMRQRIAAALQKGMEKRAAPFKMAGDWVNEQLGGSHGRPGMNANPNARDPLGSESAGKVQQLIAAAAAGDARAKEELKKWFIWNQWGTGQRPANV